MQKKPRIVIVHRIPGRIRLRLENAIPDWKRIEKDLRGHSGIHDFRPEFRLSTVAVTYNPADINEAELVLRIALSISISGKCSPVYLERKVVAGDIDREAVKVLAALFIIGGIRFFSALKPYKLFLDIAASIISATSILKHAANELKKDGTFHPETLSVVYLVVSALQGQGFRGAILSWLASYGRHFRGQYLEELIIHIEKTSKRRKQYALNLEAGNIRPVGHALKGYIPALFAHALAGGKPGEERFLTDFRDVYNQHGHMLVGLKGMADGITMNIR